MLKEDIRVGDLLRTDIDLPSGGDDHFNEERLVLVVSTDTSEWRTSISTWTTARRGSGIS